MKKKFDCVKMMRDIREKLTKETENLSTQERIDLFESELSIHKIDKVPESQESNHSR